MVGFVACIQQRLAAATAPSSLLFVTVFVIVAGVE